MANSKEKQARAEAQFHKTIKKAQDAKQAVSQYEADARAVTEKTAKLRALRLAKEAADKELAEKYMYQENGHLQKAARASAQRRNLVVAATHPNPHLMSELSARGAQLIPARDQPVTGHTG